MLLKTQTTEEESAAELVSHFLHHHLPFILTLSPLFPCTTARPNLGTWHNVPHNLIGASHEALMVEI